MVCHVAILWLVQLAVSGATHIMGTVPVRWVSLLWISNLSF